MVSLVKDIGRHRAERHADVPPVFVTVDGCVMRRAAEGPHEHVTPCLVAWTLVEV